MVVDFGITQMVYSFLVRIDDKLEVVPDLVRQVPTVANGGLSADGKTYKFTLRPDVRFHDGKSVTSADVKFMQDLMLDPKTQPRCDRRL